MSTRTQSLPWGGLAVLLPLGISSLALGTADAAPVRPKPKTEATSSAATSAADAGAGPNRAAPAPAGAATPAGSAKPTDTPAATPSQLQEATAGPKEEAARAHYSRAVEQYLQGNYANAWLEFSSAYQITPLTALLNNMARCEVKIGRPVEALQHFRRYLAATPDDPDADYIRQEIARLEAELGRRAAPSQTDAATDKAQVTTMPRRIPVYSIAAGATTLAVLLSGVAALSTVAVRYGSLETGCKPGCPPLDVTNLQQQSYAGYGLLGAAVVPAILTIVALKFELGRPAETTLRPLAGLRLNSPLFVFGSN